MYTRSYSDDGHGIIIPESYGGTLLREDERVVREEPSDALEEKDELTKNPWEGEKEKECQCFFSVVKNPIRQFSARYL